MMKPEGKEELDKAPFVYRIEWKEGTKKIELQDKSGNVLASREVSPNKPEIKVLYTNGEEVFAKGEKIKIKWEASDKDGDELTFSLAISMNGGKTWLPVDIDIKGNEYDLSTIWLDKGENYLIKVRATDGVNTAEDVSDGMFSIKLAEEVSEGLKPKEEKSIKPEFDMKLLLIAAGAIILILIIIIFVRRK